KPPAVLDAGIGQRFEGVIGIPNSVNAGFEPERLHRLEQELVQLGGALVVTPVPDPYEVSLAGLIGNGPKQPRVGRLVPGPGPARPLFLQIKIAQDVSEGEYAVVVGQVVCRHRLATGDGAMMRVVKQKLIRRAPTAV